MSDADPLLLYGATGYSGRVILDELLRQGVRPTLGGRDEGKVAPLAERHGLPYRVASLQDSERLQAMLHDVRVVLHAAGPFSATAHLMVAACLRAGAHYLDITGEPTVIERLATRHAEARRRRTMILPGIGFDVVASDCLAAHVAARVPGARRLTLAIRGLELMSRGSALSFVEQAGQPVLVRRGGALTPVPPGELERDFDFGDGPRRCVNVSWGDVVTAYYSTGIPDIEIYFEPPPLFRAALLASRFAGPLATTGPWQVWLKMHADFLPEGPTEAQRAAVRVVLLAEVEGSGRRASARLHTPQSYSFTGLSAAAIVRRVLSGDLEVGFQTPARVYGPDFVLSLAGVSRADLT